MTPRSELFQAPTRQRVTVRKAGHRQAKQIAVGSSEHRHIITSVLEQSLGNRPGVQILECESILLLEDNDEQT
jgi:hypothetical protein